MSENQKTNWGYVLVSVIVCLGVLSVLGGYFRLSSGFAVTLALLAGGVTHGLLRITFEADPLEASPPDRERGSSNPTRPLGPLGPQVVRGRSFHVLKNETQLGPYTREHVANMLKIGQLSWDDLCRGEDMIDWVPLSTVMARPSSVPPPPPSFAAGTRPLPRTSTATPPSRPAAPFDGTPLLVSYAFCLVAASVIELSGGGLTLVVLIVLAGLAVFAALHYQCWKQVPGEFRRLEPKKAAGLMLIPLFNLYWAFVAMPALADSIERWELAEGDRTGSGGVIRAVAKVYATVILVTTVLTIVDPYPGVLVFAYVADLICAVLFFRSALKAERRLLGA